MPLSQPKYATFKNSIISTLCMSPLLGEDKGKFPLRRLFKGFGFQWIFKSSERVPETKPNFT